MKNKRLNMMLMFAFVATLLTMTTAIAQDTASAIRGTINDADGNALSGATVTIKHEPTGSTKTLTTNTSGVYQARGLRVGGPYTIAVSNSGYNSGEQTDIYLLLGDIQHVDVVMSVASGSGGV